MCGHGLFCPAPFSSGREYWKGCRQSAILGMVTNRKKRKAGQAHIVYILSIYRKINKPRLILGFNLTLSIVNKRLHAY